MAQNKILNIPPQNITAAVANLLNCAISSLAGAVGMTNTQPYLIVKHIRVVNNDTAAAHTFKLFKGATGGSASGTEWGFAGGVSVPAAAAGNTPYVDWYGQARFDAADFLTGGADTTAKLTINIDAEVGFS